MEEMADQIIARAEARCDQAFGTIAALMTDNIFQILSVQAPLVVYGGRIYASVAATPGAPPRRVTGNLQAHVGFEKIGVADWVFGIRSTVVYARPLESWMNHAFFSVVMSQSRGEMDILMRHFLDRG